MGNAIRGIQPVSCCKFLIVLWISFFVFNGISAQDTPSLYSSQEAQIIALFDSVNASDKYIEKLDSGGFSNLPLGIMDGNEAGNPCPKKNTPNMTDKPCICSSSMGPLIPL